MLIPAFSSPERFHCHCSFNRYHYEPPALSQRSPWPTKLTWRSNFSVILNVSQTIFPAKAGLGIPRHTIYIRIQHLSIQEGVGYLGLLSNIFPFWEKPRFSLVKNHHDMIMTKYQLNEQSTAGWTIIWLTWLTDWLTSPPTPDLHLEQTYITVDLVRRIWLLKSVKQR